MQALTDPQLMPVVIGALSAIIGAAVGSLPALIGTQWANRSAERKHLRELILQAALENYKADLANAKLMSEREPNSVHRVLPLTDYLLAMGKLVHIVDQPMSAEALDKALAEFDRYVAVARTHWVDQRKARPGVHPAAPANEEVSPTEHDDS